MNENPGGTPNPLNPQPDVQAGPGASPLDANPSEPVQPVQQMQPIQQAQPVQSVQSVQPVQPIVYPESKPAKKGTLGEITTVGKDSTAPELVNAPVTEPLEQPAEPEASAASPAKKKKKTGLIVGMLACLFVAVGCAVAAILIFSNINSSDPVSMAMNKLMNSGLQNVAIDGTVNITASEESSLLSNLNIQFNSALAADKMFNSTDATLVATTANGEEISVKLSEVYVADESVYIKVDGLMDALDSLAINMPLESAEGEWIRLPLNINSADDNVDMELVNGTECLLQLVDDFRSKRSSLAEIYKDNSFISVAKESTPIAKKKNPIYQLDFDSAKLGSFVDALNSTTEVKKFYSCMQDGSNMDTVGIDINALQNAISNLPKVYVEIDGNYDITRFYTTMSTNDFTATIDLYFSYPQNVNVIAPSEYVDLDTILEQTFAEPIVEGEEVVEDVLIEEEVEIENV